MINVAAPGVRGAGGANTGDSASAAPAEGQAVGRGLQPAPRADMQTQAAGQQGGAAGISTWHPTILAFVTAKGKTLVAAEAMGLTHEVYVLELTQHMEELASAVRAITLLDSFDIAKKAKMVLDLNMDDFKAEELVKLYTATLAQIERMTGGGGVGMGSTVNNTTYNVGNVEQKIVQSLPPHAQAALMKLRESRPDILEHVSTPELLEAEG